MASNAILPDNSPILYPKAWNDPSGQGAPGNRKLNQDLFSNFAEGQFFASQAVDQIMLMTTPVEYLGKPRPGNWPMPTLESCDGCRTGEPFPIDFTMAFQPIVDVVAHRIWGYEALVRGVRGESAGAVLAAVTEHNRYKFDQACRVKAIELAGEKMPVGSTAMLSINFMPNAVYEPSACIRASLAAARRANFDPKRLMFEFTEDEQIKDTAHIEGIIASYRKMGFTTAIDDFGAGYAGLSLLAKFQPDLIKIDMELVRGVNQSPARQAIIKGIVEIATALKITVLAEGVETAGEMRCLAAAGVRLHQGYFFAKPAVEAFVTDVGLSDPAA